MCTLLSWALKITISNEAGNSCILVLMFSRNRGIGMIIIIQDFSLQLLYLIAQQSLRYQQAFLVIYRSSSCCCE